WFEVFRLPMMGADRLISDMRAEGEDRLFAAIAAERGVVLALSHMGNWDHAGAWVIACGAPGLTTVAERLKPESLARRFFAFREGLGFEVLPATGGVGRFGVLAQRLRAGGLVCLLADGDISGGGIEVDFFGEKAHMMAGPAALAVQTGAALMPVTLWFEGPLWHADIHEEIPVPEAGARREKVAAMTQQVARVFETGIAAHPQDWHMLQRVFTADLDLARLAAAAARAQAAEAAAAGGRRPAGRGATGPGAPATTGQERAALNGEVDDAALDGLVGDAGAGESGGGGPGGTAWACPTPGNAPAGGRGPPKDTAGARTGRGAAGRVVSPAAVDPPPRRWVVRAGRAVPVPYSGSVARRAFGSLSGARVRRWVKEGGFAVLHVHEPAAPSLSLLACWVADGPIVATFHTANPRSRALHAAYLALQTALEKISGRIAVSEAARTTLVEHMGGDAVLIPNGVTISRYENACPLPGWPGEGGVLGFLGRMDEPRKGLDVLLRAFELLAAQRPGLRLLVAGPGDVDDVRYRVPGKFRD